MCDPSYSAHALPSLPGEHVEAVVLDVTTDTGVQVVEGRATVLEGTRVVFVDIPGYLQALDRYAASAMLQHAVRHRLIGSDTVRSAVERGFTVKGLKAPLGEHCEGRR